MSGRGRAFGSKLDRRAHDARHVAHRAARAAIERSVAPQASRWRFGGLMMRSNQCEGRTCSHELPSSDAAIGAENHVRTSSANRMSGRRVGRQSRSRGAFFRAVPGSRIHAEAAIAAADIDALVLALPAAVAWPDSPRRLRRRQGRPDREADRPRHRRCPGERRGGARGRAHLDGRPCHALPSGASAHLDRLVAAGRIGTAPPHRLQPAWGSAASSAWMRSGILRRTICRWCCICPASRRTAIETRAPHRAQRRDRRRRHRPRASPTALTAEIHVSRVSPYRDRRFSVIGTRGHADLRRPGAGGAETRLLRPRGAGATARPSPSRTRRAALSRHRAAGHAARPRAAPLHRLHRHAAPAARPARTKPSRRCGSSIASPLAVYAAGRSGQRDGARKAASADRRESGGAASRLARASAMIAAAEHAAPAPSPS